MLELREEEGSLDIRVSRGTGQLLGHLRQVKVGEEVRLLGLKQEIDIQRIAPREKEQISAEMARRGIFVPNKQEIGKC